MRRLPLPAAPSLDESLDAIGTGERAALLHAELRTLVADREAATLRKLVAEHRNGTLTDLMARTAVAAIAEGRALLEECAQTMRLGSEARHRAAQASGHSRAGAA